MSYDFLRGRQLAPESCANLLDVSLSQVYRWISGGEIIVTRLGPRCTRVDGDSVADFLLRRQSVPGQPRGKHSRKRGEGFSNV